MLNQPLEGLIERVAAPLVTRREAISRGLNRYFTGKPCKFGHVAERYVQSYNCVVCQAERAVRHAGANPEKRREIHRAYRAKNALKLAAQKKIWKAINRDRHNASRRQWLITRYMSVDSFNEMLAEQHGRCAICGTDKGSSSGKDNRRLAVDHCHKTGRVRGLLCGNCNRMLGLAKDLPELLRRAASYLEAAQ